MTDELTPALRPDFFGQLAATDPHQGRARRLFERGQVVAVNGNQADLLVGYDARNNPLELKQVPIISGYVPRMGDWVSIQYEAGHSGAPWVTGPSMAADEAGDSAGIGVFSVSGSEPADPQRSMVYFDESHETWRGWDGTDWVDFSAKLHNNLPDLQGGGGGDYFHLAAGEHTALQDLQDGSGLASAWVKRLRFKAIDASASQRTQMFEVNGDFYWAVNATYDEGADEWNRVDTAKYAYLIAVHSEGNIPTEPIGGVVWWRATPGENPIGNWGAAGGWELGYMMTEHRNFVMGGMNLEMDGSGAPPYGRLTHSGSNDASGTVVTAMQRNSWYEGSGQWARDSHDRDSAIIGFNADADLFVWWYPDSSEGNAPWGTAAWQERATFHLSGDTRGRFDVIRSSAETSVPGSSFLAKHRTSGDMVDGFASGYLLAVEGSAGVENLIGAMYGERAGADNTGRLSWHVASGGVLAERMALTAGGVLSVVDLALSSPSNIYALSHDSFADFVAAEHINWKNAVDDLLTTGSGTFAGVLAPQMGPSGDADLLSLQANEITLNHYATSDVRGGFTIDNPYDGHYTYNDILFRHQYTGIGLTSNARISSYRWSRATGGVNDALILETYDRGTSSWNDNQLRLKADGNTYLAGSLMVYGGSIGTTADTDLLGLAANTFTVNGKLQVGYGNYGDIRTDAARGFGFLTIAGAAQSMQTGGIYCGSSFTSSPPSGGVIVATGYIRTNAHFSVDGTQVVSNQQAAVTPFVGGDSLADIGAKFNDLLGKLQTHGLIA